MKRYDAQCNFPHMVTLILLFTFCLLFVGGCENFIEIDPPRTDLVKSTVFSSDVTANAAMVDIYYELNSTGFASGTSNSITFFATFSADEQINYSLPVFQEFNDNDISPQNEFVLSLWSQMYNTIYKANAIIEGVNASRLLSAGLKARLDGEAKFIRAFCHFYLVNLFGDVPLITDTDYRSNSDISRTAEVDVYHQIINDLRDAQTLLPEDYGFANNERVRANRGAATALLARTYLHVSDWHNAELESTKIIQNTALYSLVSDLNAVFLKNNTEAIFQLENTYYPGEFLTLQVFDFFGGPHLGALRPEFINNFEAGDQRRTSWVKSVTVGNETYLSPGKYKIFSIAEEYSTILRLAEMYLIRAEARAKQNNIIGSQEDINVVRDRAGLTEVAANDQAALLVAIEHERVVELFTEQGLRWLDLRRTNRANEILAAIKGGTWQSTDVLYPIPEYQILNDPAMRSAQNPGY